jgi:hypothetical protein
LRIKEKPVPTVEEEDAEGAGAVEDDEGGGGGDSVQLVTSAVIPKNILKPTLAIISAVSLKLPQEDVPLERDKEIEMK